MPNYAIHDGSTILNILVADSVEIAEEITGFNAFETSGQPSIGWIFVNDEWLPPCPYRLWVWDSELNEWVPPIPMPDDGGTWIWDDTNGEWIELVTE